MSTGIKNADWMLRPLAELPNFQSSLPEVAALVYQSGPEYFDLLFGNGNAAQSWIARWMPATTSGFSYRHVQLLLVKGEIGGLALHLTGKELAVSQRPDLLFLRKACKEIGNDALRQNTDAIRAMTPPVGEDEYYLRSLSVRKSLRGNGFGKALLQQFLCAGAAQGYRRFRLDVLSGNTQALRLYTESGFRISSEYDVPVKDWKLYSMILSKREL